MSSCKPLYCIYPRQCQPQPAYLYILESGDHYCDYSGEIGSTRSDVWHGLTLRFNISPELTQKQIDELLIDSLPLVEKIQAHSKFVYRGTDLKRELDDEGEEASDELEELCEEIEPDYEHFCAECGCESCYSETDGKCMECSDCLSGKDE